MVYKISLLDIGWKGVHVDLAFAPIDQQSRNPHLQSRKISLI